MAHEPRLDTILMVERAIVDAEDYPMKTQLWKRLPRRMLYHTFKRVLEYLEASNKIVYDGRKIIWVYPDNPKLRKMLEGNVPLK